MTGLILQGLSGLIFYLCTKLSTVFVEKSLCHWFFVLDGTN